MRGVVLVGHPHADLHPDLTHVVGQVAATQHVLHPRAQRHVRLVGRCRGIALQRPHQQAADPAGRLSVRIGCADREVRRRQRGGVAGRMGERRPVSAVRARAGRVRRYQGKGGLRRPCRPRVAGENRLPARLCVEEGVRRDPHLAAAVGVHGPHLGGREGALREGDLVAHRGPHRALLHGGAGVGEVRDARAVGVHLEDLVVEVDAGAEHDLGAVRATSPARTRRARWRSASRGRSRSAPRWRCRRHARRRSWRRRATRTGSPRRSSACS